MAAVESAPIVLHADKEHSGIRVTIFVTLFLAYLLFFQLLIWSLERFAPPSLVDYSVFLACFGAAPFALLVIWALEKYLKRVWHSGLSISLNQQGMSILHRRQAPQDVEAEEPAISWAETFNQISWYFRLSGYPRGGRERRLPAKWLCLATEFQQNDSRLNVFTFMPPAQAELWTREPANEFRLINPAELYENSFRSRIGPPSRPDIPNRLLQSKEGRHWLAERRRWEDGIELAPEDFDTLMRFTKMHLYRENTPSGRS
ncbi:MAG TPA: hypothetical protein VF434_10935 [Promineifilum sp.]